jgi:hypothetical protein
MGGGDDCCELQQIYGNEHLSVSQSYMGECSSNVVYCFHKKYIMHFGVWPSIQVQGEVSTFLFLTKECIYYLES